MINVTSPLNGGPGSTRSDNTGSGASSGSTASGLALTRQRADDEVNQASPRSVDIGNGRSNRAAETPQQQESIRDDRRDTSARRQESHRQEQRTENRDIRSNEDRREVRPPEPEPIERNRDAQASQPDVVVELSSSQPSPSERALEAQQQRRERQQQNENAFASDVSGADDETSFASVGEAFSPQSNRTDSAPEAASTSQPDARAEQPPANSDNHRQAESSSPDSRFNQPDPDALVGTQININV